MSIVFLLGAGASFGSSKCIPHNPALGNGKNGLFNALIKFSPNGYFADIQKSSPSLASTFINDFEEGMEQLRNDGTKYEDGNDLREMAKYFIQFQPQPKNLYVQLLQTLKNKLQYCTFVTTNYDLLIEMSAKILNLVFDYNNVVTQKVSILKIHGSPNVWPKISSNVINCKFKNCQQIIDGDVKIIQNIDEINKLCEEKNPGPVLAEYRRGKRVANCKQFTDQQIDLWKDAVKKASKCFIIGLRLNKTDRHIWEPLKTSNCKVYYYSPDKTDIKKILSWKTRSNIYTIEKDFSRAFSDIKTKLKL